MPKQKQNKEVDGRQKLMVALIPVLAIVAIFVFYNASMSGSTKTTIIDEDMSANPIKASAKLQWEIPEPYPANTRDPMQFSSASRTKEVSGSAFAVKAIVYSEDDPSAIVNSQIVRVGDIVNDAVIIAIYKDSVEFKKSDKTWKQKIER